jgi:putative inorganic carbon (hco3(-)) transporter
MSQTEIVVPGPFKNNTFVIIAMAVISLVLAVIIGLTSTVNMFVALAVILLFSTTLLFTLFKFQNLIVMFVAFIIYTNTSVVLIKFHDVPAVLGYALPLLLLFPFMWNLITNRQKIKVNFVFLLMLVYFAVMLLGSAFSRDINLAVPSLLNYVAEGLGLYFLLINTIRTPRLLNGVVWSLLLGGALIGGLSLYQQITGTFDNNYWGFAQVTGQGFVTNESLLGEDVQPRVSGSIGEKNRYAQAMLMLVPIGLFHAWGEQSRRLRLLAYLLTGLIFIGGSLAFSRGAQVGLLLLIAIMTFMRYIKVRQLLVILLGVVLLVMAFPQNRVRFSSLGAVFAAEEEGGLRSADGAIQGRATEMLAAMLVFIDHPIIGVGPGMFGYEMAEYSRIISIRHITATREAHSLYPGVAAETGALGFITLMSIFIYVLYRLAKSRSYWLERNNTRLANLNTGFSLAIISYMTTGIFLHFAYIRYFWLIIALAVVASGFRESDLAMNEKVVGENTT